MNSSNTQIIVRTELLANHGQMDALYEEGNVDPSQRPDFFQLFAQSEFFVLESGEAHQIYAYAKNGKTLVPIFTSINQMRHFIPGTQLNRYRRMKAAQLVSSFPAGVEIILNPKSKFSTLFPVETLRAAVHGPAFAKLPPVPTAPRLAPIEAPALPVKTPTLTLKPETAPVPKKASAAVVRRNLPTAPKKSDFPVKLATSVSSFCASNPAVEAAYLAVLGEQAGNRIVIGLNLTAIREEIKIDDMLAELALFIDDSIEGDRAVEICLIEESEPMQTAIKNRVARQIFLQPFGG